MHQTNKLRYKGLSQSEVIESRKQFGANVLTPPEKDPWWKQFFEKFDDPIIRILMIAAGLAVTAGIFKGEYVEGLGIIIAILLATFLAFINEYKAGKQFDILNKVTDDVEVKVVRDSTYATVPRKDIVVNDIVLIEMGDEVPADGIILEGTSLLIDEAKLTGESEPSPKFSKDESGTTAKSEATIDNYKVMKGTMVADGHAVICITAVGDGSEIAKIIKESESDNKEKSPLNQQLEKLSTKIGVVGLFVAALTYIALISRDLFTGVLQLSTQQLYASAAIHIFALIALSKIWLPIVYDFFEWVGKNYTRPGFISDDDDEKGKNEFLTWVKLLTTGVLVLALLAGFGYVSGIIYRDAKDLIPAEAAMEFLNYFMIAVTIIVVAVPEGLAMSVTLSLAYSMKKMTASNNLVRKMDACETIGAATCICSDKTGTLTMNRMTVYADEIPNFEKSDIKQLVFEGVSVNSTANLGGVATEVIGNPTEGALLLWADSKGESYLNYRLNTKVRKQWSFSNKIKMMGTCVNSQVTGTDILYIKGAPEIVLEKCSSIGSSEIELTADSRQDILVQLKDMQKRGMRTLGIAYRKSADYMKIESLDLLQSECTWLGFFAISDPVRPEVPASVAACRNAGIDVKIVTGDNSDTAAEIGKQIGLFNDHLEKDEHLTGSEFESLNDQELMKKIGKLKILSRAKPMDKLRLVKMLKESGNVVAVTGDGTNDAPALNHADVGLAMGKSGTALAKDASDIILLDDSFKSIVNAVMWGRSLYQNIQRFILFQLTINVVALGIALLGPFIGVQLPLTVTQMLWVNLIMDTFAALALATEPPKTSVLKVKPRQPEDFIVSKPIALQIIGYAIPFLILLIFGLFYILEDSVVSNYELSVFFTVFVMLQFWNMFNARALFTVESALKGLWNNKAFLLIAFAIFVGQILIVEFGGSAFRTVPLKLADWFYIIMGTSVVLIIGETLRLFERRRARNRID